MAGIDDIAFQQPHPLPSEGTKQVEKTDGLSLLMATGVWFPFCAAHSRENKAQQHSLQILLGWDRLLLTLAGSQAWRREG